MGYHPFMIIRHMCCLCSGAKKKKSKGVVLSSEALAAASNVTGLLKFLALENISRYRIVKLGAVPVLISIYHDSSRLLLRRNAQVMSVAHIPWCRDAFDVPSDRCVRKSCLEKHMTWLDGSLKTAYRMRNLASHLWLVVDGWLCLSSNRAL